MPGTLHVVATPIGNLEDVTFRALRVLREVALIAAEDTRRTARLLQHYSISTPTTSLHAHNERARLPGLLARLQAGESVALVSDAGTPLISDPGALLVAAAHEAGIRVEPVPGPSAALAVVSAAGFTGHQILFLGFPPHRSKARRELFQNLGADGRVGVFFEAPHRIRASLEDLASVIGERPVAIGREITKRYEKLAVRPISEHLAEMGEPRGEYTVAVAPPRVPDIDRCQPAEVPSPEALRAEFSHLVKSARSRREAVKLMAAKYRCSTRALYSVLVGSDDS
jgi:16S rRNA (cytidine1402-2'-O)-methyltransferase